MTTRDTTGDAVSGHSDRSEHERMKNVRPPEWENPVPASRYDFVIVGAGSTGLAAAHAAVARGAKVALVERNLLGGTSLNIGCVPSKAIIRASRVCAEISNAERYGVYVPPGARVDFSELMKRMRSVRARISRVDSARELAARGVDVFFDEARFTERDSLSLGDATLRFKRALIATGARPDTPEIPGLAASGFLTNENLFELTHLPRRLLVIGGGPFGCEMAQAFCRLGVHTTIVQNSPMFLPGEERDAAQILSDAFARDGLAARLDTMAVSVRRDGTEKVVDLVREDTRETIVVDAILTGTGRLPNVDGLNLEAAGVAYDTTRGVHVDDFLRTANPRIYAAGDACLEYKFSDTAEASAHIAVSNALFRGRKRLSALTVPWCTYTDPEIAHVGLGVREARERGIDIATFTVPMHDVDRAIVDSETTGFVKIHVMERTDRILGATIVGSHAGEMISEITLAIVAGVGLERLASVMHPYPTESGGIRQAADAFVLARHRAAGVAQ